MDGPRDCNTKQRQTEKTEYHMISLIVESRIQHRETRSYFQNTCSQAAGLVITL